MKTNVGSIVKQIIIYFHHPNFVVGIVNSKINGNMVPRGL